MPFLVQLLPKSGRSEGLHRPVNTSPQRIVDYQPLSAVRVSKTIQHQTQNKPVLIEYLTLGSHPIRAIHWFLLT